MSKMLALTRLAQKLRQLCDIYSNPSRFIFGEQLCCRSSPRLILEISIGELLPVLVANDKAGIVVFLDRPQRREAARGWDVCYGQRW
jgi:hypothetical protein